ncbi:Cof-type HAD-IIB family hydrolase [Enterococcus sp.]|uniref:Cof-type HAD-IIB family hydrolase n=1 Tax=Enterococcus sp. TaxID=35783 RepID=UPI0025C1E9C3|nr:Cof-type HAD-IIB family hydrolase [Enterococcus sp.]
MKLFAIDIDGTLLTTDHQISEINRKAIQQAAKLGHKIAICTGRSLNSAEKIFQEIGLSNGYVIALNGAYIKEMSRNAPLWKKTVHRQAAQTFLTKGSNYGMTGYLNTEKLNYRFISKEESQENIQEFQNQAWRLEEQSYEQIPLVLAENATEILKVALSSNQISLLQAVQEEMQQAGFRIVFSDTNYIEMMDPTIDKGAALAFLSQYLNVSPTQVVAFGDQQNDLEMLTFAGCGVAMGNAIPSLKAIADEITLSNNESGVGHKIIEILNLRSL